MANIKGNFVGFSSNLDKFRTEEKYADVTLICEDEQSFRCHKVILRFASVFFDTMFEENTNTQDGGCTYRLPGTSPDTFKRVLEFIYTRNVVIGHENVCSMLEAAQFFKLPGISELCFDFVRQNKMNVQNTVDVFVYASKTGQQRFLNVLKDDIVEQLEIFSRSTHFHESLSFDGMMVIAEHMLRKYIMNSNDIHDEFEVLLGAMIRWCLHNQENRMEYFQKFISEVRQTIDFSEPQNEIINLVSQLHVPSAVTLVDVAAQLDTCGLIQVTSHTSTIGYNDVVGMSRDGLKMDLDIEDLLYVYVKYANEKLMRVFSLNRDIRCAFVDKIPINYAEQWMKTVTMNDDYLCSLHYTRRNRALGRTRNQSFYLHTSVDMRSSVKLRPPPVIFDDVNLCSLKNKIYVYNQTLSRTVPTINSSNLYPFSDEEISRGIYMYNYEVDSWFPVPAMKETVKDACMSAYDRILYVIGGSLPDGSTPVKLTQAYDHRSGLWHHMQETIHEFVGAGSYTHTSVPCIYICGGEKSKAVECTFITNNGEVQLPHIQWVDVKNGSELPERLAHHRLSVFGSKLWLMGGYSGGVPSSSSTIWVRPVGSVWTRYPSILAEAARDAKEYKAVFNSGTILDSVVFKSG